MGKKFPKKNAAEKCVDAIPKHILEYHSDKDRCRCLFCLPLCCSLDDLIWHYRTEAWHSYEACLNMLDSTLELVVGDLNPGKSPDSNKFKRSTHQFCMPNATIREACNDFDKNRTVLEAATDFSALYSEVCKIAKNLRKFKVKNSTKESNFFGVLASYDFAVRYGYKRMKALEFPQFKLWPDKLHLHAGAYEGAKAFWEYLGLDKKYLKFDDNGIIALSQSTLASIPNFDKRLLDLSPLPQGKPLTESSDRIMARNLMHLENFFCIYHINLKEMAGTLSPEKREQFIKRCNKQNNKIK